MEVFSRLQKPRRTTPRPPRLRGVVRAPCSHGPPRLQRPASAGVATSATRPPDGGTTNILSYMRTPPRIVRLKPGLTENGPGPCFFWPLFPWTLPPIDIILRATSRLHLSAIRTACRDGCAPPCFAIGLSRGMHALAREHLWGGQTSQTGRTGRTRQTIYFLSKGSVWRQSG